MELKSERFSECYRPVCEPYVTRKSVVSDRILKFANFILSGHKALIYRTQEKEKFISWCFALHNSEKSCNFAPFFENNIENEYSEIWMV